MCIMYSKYEDIEPPRSMSSTGSMAWNSRRSKLSCSDIKSGPWGEPGIECTNVWPLSVEMVGLRRLAPDDREFVTLCLTLACCGTGIRIIVAMCDLSSSASESFCRTLRRPLTDWGTSFETP